MRSIRPCPSHRQDCRWLGVRSSAGASRARFGLASPLPLFPPSDNVRSPYLSRCGAVAPPSCCESRRGSESNAVSSPEPAAAPNLGRTDDNLKSANKSQKESRDLRGSAKGGLGPVVSFVCVLKLTRAPMVRARGRLRVFRVFSHDRGNVASALRFRRASCSYVGKRALVRKPPGASASKTDLIRARKVRSSGAHPRSGRHGGRLEDSVSGVSQNGKWPKSCRKARVKNGPIFT